MHKIFALIPIILGLTLAFVSIRELVEKEYPREEKNAIILCLIIGIILVFGGGYLLFR